MGGKGSGGAREGAGSKKKVVTYSEQFKTQAWKAIESDAKKHGETIFDYIIARVRTEKHATAAASLFKTLCEVLATRETKATVQTISTGPAIGLPPIRKPEEDTGVSITTRTLVN